MNSWLLWYRTCFSSPTVIIVPRGKRITWSSVSVFFFGTVGSFEGGGERRCFSSSLSSDKWTVGGSKIEKIELFSNSNSFYHLPLLVEIDLINSSASLSRDCALTPINGPAETGAGLLHFLSQAAADTSDSDDSFSSEHALLTSAACLNSDTLKTAFNCRSSLIVWGLFGFELARSASMAAL